MPNEILTQLVSHGIVGVIAALFIGLYLMEKLAHDKTRTAHAEELKVAAEKAERLALAASQEMRAHLSQINDLREAHAIHEHACLQTVEDFATAQVGAVEELGRIASTIRKIHDRRNK